MKQETLEESAERLYPRQQPDSYYGNIELLEQEAFEQGAKWQQERSYSEEEFKDMVYHMVGGLAQANNMTFNGAILDELFNKFKNK